MENLTRRRLMQSLAGAALHAGGRWTYRRQMHARPLPAADHGQRARRGLPYSSAVLPPGIRSRFVDNINGLRMHVLEAGFEAKGRPGVLLLHGFPELAYSWRKVMLPIASAGYHVIAPDLRGYGRTSGTDVAFDDDLAPFRTLNHGAATSSGWCPRSATARWPR